MGPAEEPDVLLELPDELAADELPPHGERESLLEREAVVLDACCLLC